MIKMGNWVDILGRDVPRIDIQPWQHIQLSEYRSAPRAVNLHMARMQVTHSFGGHAITTVVVVVPALDIRVEAEIRGENVSGFMFALWLAVEHRRAQGNYWERFVQDMRRRAVYVEFTYERTFVRPRWDTPTPPARDVSDAVGYILTGGYT